MSTEAMPDVVYHYTSMEALLKIVESKSLWATNIRYLNDVLERDHCLASVRRRIQTILPHSPLDASLFARLLENDESRKSFSELPYVVSFSADKDSLMQWRSYCPGGNGVCIGFCTESIKGASVDSMEVSPFSALLPPAFVSFEAVRYLSADDIGAVDDLIYAATEDSKEMVKSNEEEEYPAEIDRSDCFLYAIEKYASRTKHISFSSEKEYRLVVTEFSGLSAVVQYRPSRSTLVPYVPVKLVDPKSFLPSHRRPKYAKVSPYFIDSVIVGPTPHPELTADALAGLFSAREVDVIVHKSSVPFRDW